MTISTSNEKTTSIPFWVFIFSVFWIFKFFVLNKFFENQSGIHIYGTIVTLALFTGFVYILMDIYFTGKREDTSIRMSSCYVEVYGCSLFMGHENVFIIRSNKEKCEVYINRLYFSYTQLQTNKPEYLAKIKSRFTTLNKMDIIYIYSYKYIYLILITAILFVVWQIYSNALASNNLITMFGIVILIFPVYYITTKICLFSITKIMEKRNLDMFTFR